MAHPCGHQFFAGDLGPSTIVGSAAFNLLIILGVCIVAVVPVGERKIEGLDTYACTAFFSIFAYVWLVVILKFITPNVVDLWEALVTFAMFPLLVFLAYQIDSGKLGIPGIPKSSHISAIGTSHFHPYEIEKYLAELEVSCRPIAPPLFNYICLHLLSLSSCLHPHALPSDGRPSTVLSRPRSGKR